MWIVFGGKTRAKQIADGRKGMKHCLTCERATAWVECDVTDKGHIFFIELVSSTTRNMVCCACGDSMDPTEWDLERRAEAVRPPPPPSPQAHLPPRRPPDDDDIERELAALKRKMK